MKKPEVEKNARFVEFSLQFFAMKVPRKDVKVEFELDLNPFLRLFEKDEEILKTRDMKKVFEYLIDFMDRLERLKKIEKRSRKGPISKVMFRENSPATANISFSSSYNGDLPPSKGGKGAM